MPQRHPLFEEVESLQNLVVSHATGGAEDEAEYTRLRQVVLAEPSIEAFIPRFIRTSRSLGQFWQFIKNKYGTYAERRKYLWDEFAPMLDLLEKGGTAPSDGMPASATACNDASVFIVFTPISSPIVSGRPARCQATTHSIHYVPPVVKQNLLRNRSRSR